MGVKCDTVLLFSLPPTNTLKCREHVSGRVASCPHPTPCGGLSREPAVVLGGGGLWGLGGGHAAIGLSKVTLGKSWLHICSQAWRPDPRQAVPGSCAPPALHAAWL